MARQAIPTPRRQVRPEAEPGYVCFAGQDWWYHNRAHSDFQLMLGVAERRKVLVVNSIGMRMPRPGRSTMPLRRIARKVRSMAKLVRRPVPGLPNFHVMTPVMLPFYGSARARAVSAWLVRAQVQAVGGILRLGTPVCVVTIPTAWDVVRGMRRRSLVFNRSDRQSEFPEADQAVIRPLEENLLREADHVLYVSHALMDIDAPLVGDRAVFLDHGVDLSHFRTRSADEEPADLRAIPRPRVGFFGGLDDYLVDFDLLERLAGEIPEAQLVLIGDATVSMRRFESRPNVHWLGFKPYEDIPRYGSGFDVALMPWLDNEWIRCCNPIKLKEYLALGLPVVSTDFPELDRYRALVAVASDPHDFVARVRAALAGADGEAGSESRSRRAAVAGDSWEQRAGQLIDLAERPVAGLEAGSMRGDPRPAART